MSANSQRDPYNTEVTEGDVVLISDQGIGVIRHIDEESEIVGIELTDPLGDCDGIYKGRRHFTCKSKYGIFVKFDEILRLITPEELLHKIVALNQNNFTLEHVLQMNNVKLPDSYLPNNFLPPMKSDITEEKQNDEKSFIIKENVDDLQDDADEDILEIDEYSLDSKMKGNDFFWGSQLKLNNSISETPFSELQKQANNNQSKSKRQEYVNNFLSNIDNKLNNISSLNSNNNNKSSKIPTKSHSFSVSTKPMQSKLNYNINDNLLLDNNKPKFSIDFPRRRKSYVSQCSDINLTNNGNININLHISNDCYNNNNSESKTVASNRKSNKDQKHTFFKHAVNNNEWQLSLDEYEDDDHLSIEVHYEDDEKNENNINSDIISIV